MKLNAYIRNRMRAKADDESRRTVSHLRKALRWFICAGSFICAWYVLLWTYFYPLDHRYPMIISSNYDRRPWGATIDCVVLHATVMSNIDDDVAYLTDPTSHVSAHFVVAKNGHVVEIVPVEMRAWHAGVSQFGGVQDVNDFSVGIEIVNENDGHDPYTNAQYQAVADIVRLLRTRLTIPDNRIVSHAQIAMPPGRKRDPLGFDFVRLRRMLANER